MDAANLNMINWAAALRGNRRKGAALLKAMLADPVQRAAVCADRDALSLIFGYGLDDPLAKEARGIPASAVVCYANDVFGTNFSDIAGMADGIYSISDELEERRTLWNMLVGVREAIEAIAENDAASAWLTSSLGPGDEDAFLANKDIMAAQTTAGTALSGVVWANDSTASAFALRAMNECASSANLLNGLAKSDAARSAWASKFESVSMLYDTIKETLDAAPDSLFVKNDENYDTNRNLSTLSGSMALTRASDGALAGVTFSNNFGWRNEVSGTCQITLVRNIHLSGQQNYYRMCSLVSPQKKDVVKKFSSNKGAGFSMDIRAVLTGGAGFFTKTSQTENTIGDPPQGFSYLTVGYASYVAV